MDLFQYNNINVLFLPLKNRIKHSLFHGYILSVFSLYNKLKLFLILGAESKFYYNSAPNVRALII